MYGEQTYTIWLPDFRKIKDYVSSEELRLRRTGGLEEEYERLLRDHDEILRNHSDILRSRDLVQKQQEVRALRMQRARPMEERFARLDLRDSSLNPRMFRENLGYRPEWQDVGGNGLYNYADSYGSSRGRGRNRDTRSMSVARTDNETYGTARRQRSSSLPPQPYTWPKLLAQFAHALTHNDKDVMKASGANTNSNKRNFKDKRKFNPKNTTDNEVSIKADERLTGVCNKLYGTNPSFEAGDSKEDFLYMSRDSTARQEVPNTKNAPQETS